MLKYLILCILKSCLSLIMSLISNRYNPFAHIHNDTDVLSMVNSFFTFNINGIKPNSVFDMAERKLLTAFCFYVLDKYKEQPDKQNFTCINKILATLHTTDDFDRFFNDFYKLNEEKPAYYYYKEARRCSSDSFVKCCSCILEITLSHILLAKCMAVLNTIMICILFHGIFMSQIKNLLHCQTE